MTRAAIYARFSSDLQNDRSIDDQVALCRDLGARAGYEIAAVYDDRALSGTSTKKRAGFQAMMAAASARAFDVILAEDIDRLFRDEADFHVARKRLDFLRIKIHTSSGLVSRVEGSLRAMMSAMFIENLVVHVRRGMQGVIRDGRHAGGKAYGYRPTAGSPGKLEIVEAEAAVVRRIFERYVAGDHPREIAGALNADGIHPPRGGYWRAATLNGDAVRANGILRNELYAGRLIWNRTHKVRDPDSGKRLNRPNPESEWQRVDVPHLRIVEEQTFQAAIARRDAAARLPIHFRRPPKRMLSGLLRCGACGAGMSMKDYDRGRPRIKCSQMQEAGTCSNGRAYYLQPIERAVVAGLRDHMGNREAVAHFIRCFNDEREKLAGDAIRNHSKIHARLASIDREIERTVAALIKGTITEAEAEKHLPELRQERARLAAQAAQAGNPAQVVSLHPAAVTAYLRDLERLDEAVNAGIAEGNPEINEAVRNLVETVTVLPAPAGTLPDIQVTGHLASLVAGYPSATDTRHRQSPVPVFAFVVKAA
jgi:site-specific DNA recombinase